MDLQEAIRKRRSIKKYLDISVEPEKVHKIIEAANLAPTSGNLQELNFTIIQDKAKRDELAQSCLEQWWMAKAPIHIAVCSQTQKLKQFYGQRGVEVYSHQNGAAAIQNLLLTATELGLGSCWVGAMKERMVKRALSIPDEVILVAIITLGYPDEAPKMPAKQPIEFCTFVEKYGSKFSDWDFALGRYGAHLKKKIDEAKEGIKRIVGMQT